MAALFPEQACYLAAMLGFVLFYGLEYMGARENGPVSDSRLTVRLPVSDTTRLEQIPTSLAELG